jgi:hypothetical protein
MRMSITTNRTLNRELDRCGRLSDCRVARVYSHVAPSELDQPAGVSMLALHSAARHSWQCRLLPLPLLLGWPWPALARASAATAGHHAHHPCSAAWPLLRPNRCSWHLECKAAKKSSRSTTAPGQQPTSAFSPSTHCPTCLLPSHRRHVCRTATQPEGRVEGMPSHDRARRLGAGLLTAVFTEAG